MTATDYLGESKDGTEYLLTRYPDGTHEIRVRVAGETWGAPVELTAETAGVGV